jgi:hypothetical protein
MTHHGGGGDCLGCEKPNCDAKRKKK